MDFLLAPYSVSYTHLMEELELIPQDIEAERSVIGAALLRPECAFEVLSSLQKDDFSSIVHMHVYEAMEKLAKEGITPDIVTVNSRLEALHLATPGTIEYLSGLTVETITTKNIKDVYKRQPYMWSCRWKRGF